MTLTNTFQRLLLALFAATSIHTTATAEWRLIADGKETMPMDSIVCLIASDNSDYIQVVGTSRIINNVARIWFEDLETTAVHNVQRQQSDADINIISADNMLYISGLKTDTKLRIYTTDGQLVRTLYLTPTNGIATLYIGDLASATYIYRIANYSLKFFKK